MNKKVKLLLIIICLISCIRLVCVFINDKNFYQEDKKKFIGIITNIKKDKNKTIIDVKEKEKYRLTLYKDINYKLGDKVLINGTFISAPSNTVFNLFNYRKHLLSKNIKMISNDSKIKLISKNKNILYDIKNKVIKHVEKYRTSSYLKAFILADTSLIEDDVIKSYRNIGISHLFAVSGMHIGVFLLILNLLLKEMKYKNIIIILFLLFFLFIASFPESLLRCAMFFVLNLINKKFDFKISSINLIVLTSALLLLINPYLIYSIGFLFSVTITFFIILSKDYLKGGYFRKTFITSIICFLASIPILASYFFKINFLSPLINIIFIPLISMIIFPLGLLTFIFPFLDNIYLVFINILEYLVSVLDKIEIFSFTIAKPNIIMIVLYYLSLYLMIKINRKYIILFILILIINLNMKLLIFNPSITFLDVGQGDSTIVILPKGKTILIDTGGKYMSDYSIVENKTIPYLNSLGINKIDLLILTHGDYDHIGEAERLIKNIKVRKTIINKGEVNSLEEDITNYGNVSVVKDNYKIDGYNFMFLNDKIYFDENQNSIVTYINLKNKNILLMGDADKVVEKNIIDEYNLPKMDILKVGHHGSKTSSDIKFIKKVNPDYSVISVGKNNRYGHPNKEVLNLLSNTNILKTYEDGSIKFVFKQNMVNKYVCKPYIIVER